MFRHCRREPDVQRNRSTVKGWWPGRRRNPETPRNIVELTGVVSDEPFEQHRRGDETVFSFVLDFRDPISDRRGCCLVEMPEELATAHRQDLQMGSALTVIGRLSGPGDIIPSRIESWAGATQ